MSEKFSQAELCRKYKLSSDVVYRVVHNFIWKDINYIEPNNPKRTDNILLFDKI